MRVRVALILLSLLAPGVLGSMMFGGAGLVWLGVPAICALPVLLVVMASTGRQPPLWGLLSIWTLLTGTWLAIGWLSMSTDLTQPSAGEAMAVMSLLLLGLGALPILLVGWLHGRFFDADGLSPEDLERWRDEVGR